MLTQFLLENWQEFTKTPVPESIDFATLSSCNEEYGNDLVLIFVGRARTPCFVLKVARNKRYNFKLERENQALITLNKFDQLSWIVPTSFAHGFLRERFFFLQGGIGGQNLNNYLRTTGLKKKSLVLIEKSIHLLCSINLSHGQHTGQKRCPGDDENAGLFADDCSCPLEGLDSADYERICAIRDSFVRLGRMFFLHGDYWPANILVHEKSGVINGVIDWEFSFPASAVPSDIIWFLVNLAYGLGGHQQPSISLIDAFRWGFYSSGAHNAVFRECFQQYVSRMELPQKGFFSPLLLFSLFKMAMREKETYGQHSFMDLECLKMLRYAITHTSYMDEL